MAQLEKMVSQLRANLVAEARRRKLDQRLLAEASKARAAVTQQISALRSQGSKLANEIKRVAQENRTLEQARKTAMAKVDELRTELREKTEEVRRTSAELAKLARESASRAREIIHGRTLAVAPSRETLAESSPDEALAREKSLPREKPRCEP